MPRAPLHVGMARAPHAGSSVPGEGGKHIAMSYKSVIGKTFAGE